eukprot:6275604-Alexandrium_andersonii.AAC.1
MLATPSGGDARGVGGPHPRASPLRAPDSCGGWRLWVQPSRPLPTCAGRAPCPGASSPMTPPVMAGRRGAAG